MIIVYILLGWCALSVITAAIVCRLIHLEKLRVRSFTA